MEQVQNNIQQPDPISDNRIYTDAILRFATDQKNAGQQLTSTKIFNDSSMLRDYSNIALLSLGGAITYLTVGENLIKTKWLLYSAMSLLVVAVVLSLLARRSLHGYLDKALNAYEERYTELVSAATLAYLSPSNQENQTRLKDAMSKVFGPPPQGPWERYGATAVNIAFLAGFLMLSVSLVFKIST